jgi:hypothetical protein
VDDARCLCGLIEGLGRLLRYGVESGSESSVLDEFRIKGGVAHLEMILRNGTESEDVARKVQILNDDFSIF